MQNAITKLPIRITLASHGPRRAIVNTSDWTVHTARVAESSQGVVGNGNLGGFARFTIDRHRSVCVNRQGIAYFNPSVIFSVNPESDDFNGGLL